MNERLNEIKIKQSLVCMIRGLLGRRTTIDLRNENTLTGVIENVDHLMNIDLSDVKFQNIYGEENNFEKFYVRGPNIRYVHIPADVNMLETIQEEIKKSEQVLNFKPEKIKRPKNVINREKRQKTKEKVNEKVEETKRRLGLL